MPGFTGFAPFFTFSLFLHFPSVSPFLAGIVNFKPGFFGEQFLTKNGGKVATQAHAVPECDDFTNLLTLSGLSYALLLPKNGKGQQRAELCQNGRTTTGRVAHEQQGGVWEAIQQEGGVVPGLYHQVYTTLYLPGYTPPDTPLSYVPSVRYRVSSYDAG